MRLFAGLVVIAGIGVLTLFIVYTVSQDRRSGDERRSEIKPPQDRMGAERDLIHLMLLDSSRIESAGTYLEAAHFRNPQHREIFDWLLAQSADKDTLSAEAASVLTVIEGLKEEFRDGDQAFANFIGDLLLQRILRKQALIKHRIRKASDADAHEQVQSELMPLKAEEHRIRKEFGIGFKTARLSKRARVNDSPRGQGE